jgi:hypothetical protein
MKIPSKSNFILMSLLTCLFFIACKKDYDLCEGEPETEIKYRATLSNDDMKYFPYKGNETLTFISNKGDTAILVGKGQLFKYPKLRYSGNNDCTDFYDEHEITFAEFIGNDSSFYQLRFDMFEGNFSVYLFSQIFINYLRGYGDYWEGYNVFSLYRIPPLVSQQIVFRDSLVNSSVFNLSSSMKDFPKVFYYRQYGVVAYMPDSTTIYTLQ